MRAGEKHARERGVTITQGERVDPFGSGWIISSKAGFTPCPWAFDLIEFARPLPDERVLDLGCGGGPLLLAVDQVEPAHGQFIGVDLSWERLNQAQRNLRLQSVPRSGVFRGDIRRLTLPSIFDLVLVNPPFYPAGWGRVSDDLETASATHALHGDVKDFVQAASRCLAPHGRVALIFDSDRLSDLLMAVSCTDLRMKEMRFLFDDRQKPSRVMVLLSRGAGLAIDHRFHP